MVLISRIFGRPELEYVLPKAKSAMEYEIALASKTERSGMNSAVNGCNEDEENLYIDFNHYLEGC